MPFDLMEWLLGGRAGVRGQSCRCRGCRTAGALNDGDIGLQPCHHHGSWLRHLYAFEANATRLDVGFHLDSRLPCLKVAHHLDDRDGSC